MFDTITSIALVSRILEWWRGKPPPLAEPMSPPIYVRAGDHAKVTIEIHSGRDH